MNAHSKIKPENPLANEYASRCGRMSAEMVYVEVCLRIALEVQTTEGGLRQSVSETLAVLQRAIAAD